MENELCLREMELVRANALADAAGEGMVTAIESNPLCTEATAIDVANGVFTLANRTVYSVLQNSEPEDLERNRESLRQAVMALLLSTTSCEAIRS